MAKFLIEASYTTAPGLHGSAKLKASGRKVAIAASMAVLGGKLESLHYAFGQSDVYLICDLPDHVSALAVSLAVSAAGMALTRTTPLLTVEEADQSLAKPAAYRAA